MSNTGAGYFANANVLSDNRYYTQGNCSAELLSLEVFLFRLSTASAQVTFPWRQAFFLILVYVALGHAGIHYVAFPGTFFSQVWLASGVGLIMFCQFGRRAIPLVFCASLLINTPYALNAKPDGEW